MWFFFVSFRATRNYKVSVAVKTCSQLPNWHDVFFDIFLLLQSIRVSIFYGSELVFKVSFRVRNIGLGLEKITSYQFGSWQQPWRPSWYSKFVIPAGFTFVAGWAIHLYIYIDQCQPRIDAASLTVRSGAWKALWSRTICRILFEQWSTRPKFACDNFYLTNKNSGVSFPSTVFVT